MTFKLINPKVVSSNLTPATISSWFETA